MGLCESLTLSEDDKKAYVTSRAIDYMLKEDADAGKTVMKLLLLGPGESGKSTVLKQMRIIHLNGFDQSELLGRRPGVYYNVVEGMMQLLLGLEDLNLNLSPDRNDDAAIIRSYKMVDIPDVLTDRMADALQRLWEDKMIREAYARRNEFQLNDSAFYFFESLDRIRQPTYIPTQQDVLMTRVPTSGIQEMKYTYKNITFRIFDMGGQRTERRKWLHCFECVDAIMFIVAISEFDQTLREDNKTNRMRDSLELFKVIINNEYFSKSQAILFLNKKDLFEEKIKRVQLSTYFTKFKSENTYANTTAYFMKYFERLKADKEKALYTHLTCATDTNQVQLVLNNATDMIIASNFKQTGVA